MSKCNGWTNAATWRVQLEVFSGIDVSDTVRSFQNEFGIDDVAAWASAYARSIVFEKADGLARAWALDFLSDVNWHEIAEHLIDAAQEDAA